MLEVFQDMPETARAFAEWVGDNPAAASAWAAIGGTVIAGLTFLAGRFKGKPPVPTGTVGTRADTITASDNSTVTTGDVTTVSGGTVTVNRFTESQYEAQLRARLDRITDELLEEKDQNKVLLAEKAELERRLADPGPAFEAAKARIAELEALLEREGNLLGAERLERAETALAAGDFDAADALLAEISADGQLEIERVARAEYGRGQIAEEQVRWLDAAYHYRRAAELNATYDTLEKAGTFLLHAGRSAEAARCNEDLVDLSRDQHGDEDPQTALALNNLAASYRAMGRYAEAEPLVREALEIDKATIGEQHPDYAIRLNNLAALLEARGQYAKAEPLYREALEIGKTTIGEGHPDHASRLNNLAGLLKDIGKMQEARLMLAQAVEIRKSALGEMHPDYLVSIWWTADFAVADGDHAAARDAYATALSGMKIALGADHPHTRKVGHQNAMLLRAHFPDDPALAELEATFGPEIGQGGD